MSGDFEGISTGARERLLAELHRTVESVAGAIDDAAGQMLDAAELEARRRAEEAASEIEDLTVTAIDPLRRLSSELMIRASALDREVGRLGDRVAAVVASLREDAEPAPVPPAARVPVDPSRSQPPPRSEPPPQVPPHERSDVPPLEGHSPLDEVEATRASLAEALTEISPRRRRFQAAPEEGEGPEIPAGVRVVVEQMRLAGQPDAAIADLLLAMGVEDPNAVIARLKAAS